jgi:hypothetical protein
MGPIICRIVSLGCSLGGVSLAGPVERGSPVIEQAGRTSGLPAARSSALAAVDRGSPIAGQAGLARSWLLRGCWLPYHWQSMRSNLLAEMAAASQVRVWRSKASHMDMASRFLLF